MGRDVLALLRFALTHGFLKDALIGLVSTALSDYRQLRSRIGLQRYGETEMIAKLAAAGFTASRFITHDAFEGRPAALTVMNIAHELVTVLVMAVIIGVWPPAM